MTVSVNKYFLGGFKPPSRYTKQVPPAWDGKILLVGLLLTPDLCVHWSNYVFLMAMAAMDDQVMFVSG